MYKWGACALSLILGISPQTLNSGTPFPNASHTTPILQGSLMGVVWVAGGPTSLGVPRIFPGICLLETLFRGSLALLQACRAYGVWNLIKGARCVNAICIYIYVCVYIHIYIHI